MPAAAEKVAMTLAGNRSWMGHGSGDGWFVGPASPIADMTLDLALGSSLAADDLLASIAQAADEIEAAMHAAGGLGAGMLEFQCAMLRDPELAQPALRRIAAGEGAALAWVAAMDDYIAAFQDAEGDFGARNMDLVDIRNRVLATLCGVPRAGFPAGSVFVGDDMEPSVFLEHDWTQGGAIALAGGSLTGHVAMLARSRGIPMVCGLGDFSIEPSEAVLVDSVAGRIVANPSETDWDVARQNAGKRQGTRPGRVSARVLLHANINQLGDLERFDPSVCAGVGLVRTEFLFGGQGPLADEGVQLAAYRRIAGRFREPAWIRLFDLGGDKPLPGAATMPGERGVRLLLARPELLRRQARALLRTAYESDIGVTIPMVTIPDEVEAVRAVFAEEAVALAQAGVPHAMPAIGMMVEVPAAALMLERFANAAFFSIGTNDLLQYLSATTRDDAGMQELQQKALPALAALIEACVRAAGKMGKPLGVCGDLAGDPDGVAMLTDAGVQRLSVGAAQFPRIAALFAESARP